jgi:hypothetical protein
MKWSENENKEREKKFFYCKMMDDRYGKATKGQIKYIIYEYICIYDE